MTCFAKSVPTRVISVMGLLLHKRFQIEFNNPILALDAVAWKWEVPSYSVYGLPPKRKKLIDSLAVGESPAVVYPASVVGSYATRADMESASPAQQSLRTAANESEELSASVGVGCTRLAMMVDQSRRKA